MTTSLLAPAQQAIDLWPGGPPAAPEWAFSQSECEHAAGEPGWTVWNVSRPTLTPYLPDPARATGTGIVVAPGGGFEFLVMSKEGTDVAAWLNARGIAAFILKYRLLPMPADHEAFRAEVARRRQPGEYAGQVRTTRGRFNPLSIADGRQALRLARERAAGWGVDPDRLGIMGFSAGGTVAGGTALDYDAASRPSFAVPIYGAPPVTGTTGTGTTGTGTTGTGTTGTGTTGTGTTGTGSASGPAPVPADAPPLFIAVANDDPRAADNCVNLYRAWKAAGQSAELHVYAHGGHGFGLRQKGTTSDGWIDQLHAWLKAEGFLS